ncbi:26209_t:CDS:2, partial [Dentiscutata erythropus]
MRFHLDSFIRNICQAIIEKFNKYWEHSSFLHMTACILDPCYKMQFISYYYCEKEKLTVYDLNEKMQDIQVKFEDLYLRTYHSLSTSDYDNGNIVNIESNISIFENHIDDFFKYAAKQTWVSKNDPLSKVKQYLDEPIASKNINILEWWKHNKDQLPNLSAMAQDFLAIPATTLYQNRCLAMQ